MVGVFRVRGSSESFGVSGLGFVVDLGVDIEWLSGLLAGLKLLMGESTVVGQGAGGSAFYADDMSPYNRQLVYVSSARLWDRISY